MKTLNVFNNLQFCVVIFLLSCCAVCGASEIKVENITYDDVVFVNWDNHSDAGVQSAAEQIPAPKYVSSVVKVFIKVPKSFLGEWYYKYRLKPSQSFPVRAELAMLCENRDLVPLVYWNVEGGNRDKVDYVEMIAYLIFDRYDLGDIKEKERSIRSALSENSYLQKDVADSECYLKFPSLLPSFFSHNKGDKFILNTSRIREILEGQLIERLK